MMSTALLRSRTNANVNSNGARRTGLSVVEQCLANRKVDVKICSKRGEAHRSAAADMANSIPDEQGKESMPVQASNLPPKALSTVSSECQTLFGQNDETLLFEDVRYFLCWEGGQLVISIHSLPQLHGRPLNKTSSGSAYVIMEESMYMEARWRLAPLRDMPSASHLGRMVFTGYGLQTTGTFKFYPSEEHFPLLLDVSLPWLDLEREMASSEWTAQPRSFLSRRQSSSQQSETLYTGGKRPTLNRALHKRT